MLKNIFLIISLLLGTFVYSANDYDKNIIVKNQTRDEKVKSVFKKLMKYYEEEDEAGFFSLVSEDRFLQDFMLFEQAIEKDFRTYEILDFEYWIDKITSDGVKRYLYVKWEKRYELINTNDELIQKGYSRFLFDEINGKYKLIELAGNNLWGSSLAEWKEEIPHIAGEEKYTQTETSNSEQTPGTGNGENPEQSGQPDLIIEQSCLSTGYFVIKNIGTASTTSGSIEYKLTENSGVSPNASSSNETYSGDLGPNESSGNLECGSIGIYGGTIEVDPNNLIDELDENNNVVNVNVNEEI